MKNVKISRDLASLSREELEQQVMQLSSKVDELSSKLSWYEEQYRLSRAQRFGSSSEQTAPNTPKGADASAIIYSLIETAKENDLNPFPYLQHLFEQLPNVDIQDSEILKKYLPWSKELPSICRNLGQ